MAWSEGLPAVMASPARRPRPASMWQESMARLQQAQATSSGYTEDPSTIQAERVSPGLGGRPVDTSALAAMLAQASVCMALATSMVSTGKAQMALESLGPGGSACPALDIPAAMAVISIMLMRDKSPSLSKEPVG